MFPHQYNGKLSLAVVGYTRPAEFKKTFQVKALPSLPLSALSSAFQWCGTTEQGQLSSRGISVPWFQFFTQASPGLGVTPVTGAGGTWNTTHWQIPEKVCSSPLLQRYFIRWSCLCLDIMFWWLLGCSVVESSGEFGHVHNNL